MSLVRFQVFLFSFLLLLLCGSVAVVHASVGNRIFRHIDIRDGLSQNTVNCILQDKSGYMWFATKDGLNRYDGISFRVFKNTNSGLKCNFINTIHEAPDGNIWIGSERGLFVYDPLTESVRYVDATADDTSSPLRSPILSIMTCPSDSMVYVVASGRGVYRYNPETDVLEQQLGENSNRNVSFCSFYSDRVWLGVPNEDLYFAETPNALLIPVRDRHDKAPFINTAVLDILHKGNFTFVGTDKGLYRIDHNSMDIMMVLPHFVRTLCIAPDDKTLWAGTQDGIFLVNTEDVSSITNLAHPGVDEPFSLADNAIYSIFVDKEGGMWIGTYFGGINYLPPRKNFFENYYPHSEMAQMGQRVREMCIDWQNNVWIGTEDKGLQLFDPSTKSITPVHSNLLTNNIHGLCISGDWLYVGAFAGGLERINLKTGQRRTYFANGTAGSLVSNYIFTMTPATEGGVWIGTTEGVMHYDEQTDAFTSLEGLPGTFIYHVMQSSDSVLWMATYNDGLWSYDHSAEKFKHYSFQDDIQGTIGDTKVISLYEDSKHRLWVMTHCGGLSSLDPSTGVFTTHPLDTVANRFNIVYRMVEDRQGNLWCSTNNGLVSYNPDTGHRVFYTSSDGLQSDQFNYQSGIIDSMGYLYFGCVNGFVRFRPDIFMRGGAPPRLALSSLSVFDKLQTPLSAGSVLQQSIDRTTHLTLSSDQNSFAISARILSYVSPERNSVQYFLDGYDKQWHTIGTETPVISYSNLPYSTYTLHIRGCNSEGVPAVTQRTLTIELNPPFYLTSLAKTIYALIALMLIALALRLFHLRNKRKFKIAQQILDKEKEQELYNSKIRFFTNIAHEIRTPLTLIKSPLENIINDPHINQDTKEDLDIAHRNTMRLVTLVNQLLDFRKLETDGLRPNFQTMDITAALNGISATFKHEIAQRRLRLDMHAEPKVMAVADSDLISKIMVNLIGNAVKYAATYIDISLKSEKDTFCLTITNDGPIVPLSMREEIFIPFVNYESEENPNITTTGLGLALVRSLTEMHHGSINMDNDPDANRFILIMPLLQDGVIINLVAGEHETPLHEDSSILVDTHPDTNATPNTPTQQPTLLIVEDNEQLLQFLQRHFSRAYTTLTATNGEEALSLLHRGENISIVISDVMMPGMDGVELCNAIKTDVNFSHIPVLLLTAKTAVQARIEGLRNGADAYIDKPFTMAVLEQNVRTILDNRQRLYETFAQRPYAMSAITNASSQVEQEFLDRLSHEVSANLDNPEYDVDSLAQAMNMSRSSLNRKIKATLNLTPNDYIRTERLKKAALLLNTGKYKVNEVCYMVGFNTPSYFAKCFQKQYGVLPSDVD